MRSFIMFLLLFAVSGQARASAQTGSVVGEVRDAESGQVLQGAHVRLEELNRLGATDSDGRFVFRNVPAGTYRLSFRRLGYRPATSTVTLAGGDTVNVTVLLEPSPIELAPTIVTGTIAGENEGLVRPVGVLSGRDLDRRMDNTLAATLDGEPGVAQTTMGPAASRPVIRGLSGDRVLVLEDGQRTGDVSNTGGDHAVVTDAASADRVEVLRGPAALVYGSNALGGVINVIREEIPGTLPDHLNGSVSLQAQSALPGATVQGHVRNAFGRWAVRAEGMVRETGDLRTPVGVLESTEMSAYTAGVGVSRVNGWGHLGGAARTNYQSYGVPGGFTGAHPAGVRINMRRHAGRGELSLRNGVGPFSRFEARTNFTWYRHEEIEPGGILGTLFEQTVGALELEGRHERLGPFDHGAAGVRVQGREFLARGGSGTPDSRLFTLSAFVLEDLDLDPVRIEAGVRYDFTRAVPLDSVATSVSIGWIRPRSFSALSGALGTVVDIGGGIDVGASVSRAFRTPDPTELFSQGPHLAVFTYEVGNTDLGVESAFGIDVFVRAGRDELQAEVAVFRNAVTGFIYPRETGDTLIRLQLPISQFVAEDALLQGAEGKIEWNPVRGLVLSGNASYVRGTLTDNAEPLPFMPPLRVRAGVRYETPTWFFGAGARAAARQDRTADFETPTDGYVVFDAAAGVRWMLFNQLHGIVVRVTNIADAEYRNHLSRVRVVMPEAGRDVSLLYRVTF